jgi:hypothetical protein
MGHGAVRTGVERSVLVHVLDPDLGCAIRLALETAGWQVTGVDAGDPAPVVLLVELGADLGRVRQLADRHPGTVLLLLADYLSPVALLAASTLKASAVLTKATPVDELPLVLDAHVRS